MSLPHCPSCNGALTDSSPDRERSGWASCRKCRRVFTIDRSSDARSVAGRPRFVERPAGVLILRTRAGGDAGHGSAHSAEDDAAITFRPRDKVIGLVVLAAFGLIWGAGVLVLQFVVRPSRGAPLTRDDLIYSITAAAVLILGGPLFAFIGLRRNTFSVRVSGGLVVAERGGRERFRLKPDAIAQVACLSGIVRAGEGARMRCDLVALDARGRATAMLEDVPPAQALFAEVWLEDVLGLADEPVDREFI